MPIRFLKNQLPHPDDIIRLYEENQWTNYIRQSDKLTGVYERASFFAGAFENDRCVGLIRVLTDDAFIVYIQDLLVLPEYQRRGIGKQLLQLTVEHFRHCRQIVLLTDFRENTIGFYQSCGFTDIRRTDQFELTAFVRINGKTEENR